MLDAIKIIHHYNVFKRGDQIDSLLFQNNSDEIMNKIINYLSEKKFTNEKEIFSYIYKKTMEDIEANWGKQSKGYKNSPEMCNIRKILRIFEDCGVVKTSSENGDNGWIVFSWHFTPNTWKTFFEQSRKELINIIEKKKTRFEEETLFICSQRCSNRVYTQNIAEDNDCKCENGHQLILVDNKDYITMFNNDIKFLRDAVFPSIYEEKRVPSVIKPTIATQIELKNSEVSPIQAKESQSISTFLPSLYWKKHVKNIFLFNDADKKGDIHMSTESKKQSQLSNLDSVYKLIIENWKKIVEESIQKGEKDISTILNSIRACKKHVNTVMEKYFQSTQEFNKAFQMLCTKPENADRNTKIINDNGHLKLGYQGSIDFLLCMKKCDPSLDIPDAWSKIRLKDDGSMAKKEDEPETWKSKPLPPQLTSYGSNIEDQKEIEKIADAEKVVKMKERINDFSINKVEFPKEVPKQEIKQQSDTKKSEIITIPDNLLEIIKKPVHEVTVLDFHKMCMVINKNIANRSVKVVTPLDIIQEGEKLRQDFAKIFMKLFLSDTQVVMWFNMRPESFVIEAPIVKL